MTRSRVHADATLGSPLAMVRPPRLTRASTLHAQRCTFHGSSGTNVLNSPKLAPTPAVTYLRYTPTAFVPCEGINEKRKRPPSHRQKLNWPPKVGLV